MRQKNVCCAWNNASQYKFIYNSGFCCLDSRRYGVKGSFWESTEGQKPMQREQSDEHSTKRQKLFFIIGVGSINTHGRRNDTLALAFLNGSVCVWCATTLAHAHLILFPTYFFELFLWKQTLPSLLLHCLMAFYFFVGVRARSSRVLFRPRLTLIGGGTFEPLFSCCGNFRLRCHHGYHINKIHIIAIVHLSRCVDLVDGWCVAEGDPNEAHSHNTQHTLFRYDIYTSIKLEMKRMNEKHTQKWMNRIDRKKKPGEIQQNSKRK